MFCPRCHSNNCNSIVHTTSQIQTGGYNCCAGSLGGVLLGPIGLLFGLCGNGTNTSSSTQTKWVCKDCDKEFVPKDVAKENLNTLLSGATFFAQCALFLAIWGMSSSSPLILLMACLGAAVVFICLWPLRNEVEGYRLEQLFLPQELQKWKKKWMVINIGIAGCIILFMLFLSCTRYL